MSKGPLLAKTKAFALAAIKLVHAIREHRKEYLLTNQYLRAATNPGAMAREAQHAESLPDFIHKLGIAKKETEEAGYWFELLEESGLYLTGIECREATALQNEVQRLLTAILRTSRAKLAAQKAAKKKKGDNLN